MKNPKNLVVALFLMGIMISGSSFAKNTNVEKTAIIVVDQSLNNKRSEVLMSRLNEINNMDKSNLTRREKRALRKEVLAIRDDGHNHSGIYLSVGAVIIIILLLILLL